MPGKVRVHGAPAPYLSYAYSISEFNHILALDAFIKGKIVVQDVSSMLVAEVADPKKGDYVIDVCAAPGGKSLHETRWRDMERRCKMCVR